MTKSEDKMVHDFLYGGHMAVREFLASLGMQCIASGRSLADAITEARDGLVCKHEWDAHGWCSKCHGHVKWLGIEDWRSK